MKRLEISAILFASCIAITSCGKSHKKDLAEMKNIDTERYQTDLAVVKDIDSSQSLEEALAEVDAQRGDVQSLNSYRMSDYGKKFWIGDGYDVLNGMRAPTCLDPALLQVQVRPLMQTSDTFDVVHSYVDLYKKLETEFGAEIGGAWQLLTGKVSFKSNIMRETKINSDDVVVLAGFSYVKDQISLYNSWPQYARFFNSLSQKNRALFRKYCGDRYTKDVSVGAGMYMVFTAKKTDDTRLDKNAVESAVSLGLSTFLTAGANAKFSDEQRRILQHYTFSAKCYSAGTSADVCGSYSLSTVLDVLNDTKAIQERIKQAREKIVADVNNGNNLVAIKETLVDYDVPFEACTNNGDDPCPSRWSYFTDYRDRLNRTRDMNISKGYVEEVCFKADYWRRRCARAELDLTNAILACTNSSEECRSPDSSQVDIVMSARNPGKVSMWTDTNQRGEYFEIDFSKMLESNVRKPQTFYSFYEMGWQRANDRISSIDSKLHDAWTIKFYEHLDPRNPGHRYEFRGNQYISNVGNGVNDKISAFELVPIDDIP